MIPDVPFCFTIRPLAEDEGGGYLVPNRSVIAPCERDAVKTFTRQMRARLA
jgi:hypothetical protein